MPLKVNIEPLQYLAVILTQNSITKNSLFVASREWECEKAIDDSERTGKFHILNFFYFIQVIIFSFFKHGVAKTLGKIGIGFNLISIGEYYKQCLVTIYNNIYICFNFRPVQVQQLALRSSVWAEHRPKSVCTIQYPCSNGNDIETKMVFSSISK